LERAFVTQLLNDTEDPAIIAHVEVCGTCQSRLEALLDDEGILVGEEESQANGDLHRSRRKHTLDYRHSLLSALGDAARQPFQNTVAMEQPPPEDSDSGESSSSLSDRDTASKPFAEAAPLPEVPGYEILGRLGQGGMGVVYKARHLKLNRIVALKMVLAGEHADAGKLARFHVEAEAVARLCHPNIVAIYDIGVANGMPYIALEYLPGGSLKKLFRQGPQPPRWSADLLATLAQAVHTAHLAGIVHRDLKPGNVLLAEDGTVKITDFGLAKRREDPGQTQTGQIIGTPEYMAPEQAKGDSKCVGPASDVYALGAILYETLTGRPPFRGTAVIEILHRVQSEEPVPPRRWAADVPADLETVCLKALRKEPKERYPTAQEFADELDRFLHDEPVRARPLSRLEKVSRWCRRKPTLAGLLAASVGLMLMASLAIILGFYQWRLRQEHEETEKALAAEREADRKEKRCLYVNDIFMADRLYHENQLFRARQLLEDCAEDQRGWEWHYLDRITKADLLNLIGHTQPVHTLAFAPNRRCLASGSGDGSLVFWEPGARQRLLELPGNSGPIWSLSFSSDGMRLASATGSERESGELIVWNVGDGSEPKLREAFRTRLDNRLGERAAVAYHPSKPMLAVATGLRSGQPGSLLLLNAYGEEIRRWSGTTDQACVALAWSPDGRRLAASFVGMQAGAKGEIVILDPDKAQPVYRFEADGGKATALAFSPDGRTLASGGDRLIELRDADTYTLQKTCSGHTGPVTCLAFTSEGQLVSGSRDTTVRVWDRRSGQETVIRRGHYGSVRCLAIQPETGLIYSGSDDITIKAWRAEKSQESEAYPVHQGAATAVAFSPDGTALISVGLDGAVWRIDPTGRQRPRLLRQERRPLRQVRFLPQTQSILVAGGDDEPGREDGTIRILDAREGSLTAELDTQLALVSSLSVSRGGRRLSVVGRTREHDTIVQIWDMTSSPPRYQAIPAELLPGTAVAAKLFADGGKLVVMLRQVNNFLKPSFVLFDLSNGPRLVPGTRYAISGPCFAVFTKDESIMFMGGQDQGFNKYKLGPGGLFNLARFSGHAGAIRNGALSPDERLFATASEDETIRLWDWETNRELLVLRGDASPMNDVAFSPTEGLLAAAQGSGTVRLWNGGPRSAAGRPSVSLP
jgi:WD40 repeat protein/serine/threonine protein kinase